MKKLDSKKLGNSTYYGFVTNESVCSSCFCNQCGSGNCGTCKGCLDMDQKIEDVKHIYSNQK